jgi:hypothetical protein
MMKDTGHVPMIERPPTFNAQLLEFLSGPTPDQGQDAGEGEPEPATA